MSTSSFEYARIVEVPSGMLFLRPPVIAQPTDMAMFLGPMPSGNVGEYRVLRGGLEPMGRFGRFWVPRGFSQPLNRPNLGFPEPNRRQNPRLD
jgi:hypothetical protein